MIKKIAFILGFVTISVFFAEGVSANCNDCTKSELFNYYFQDGLTHYVEFENGTIALLKEGRLYKVGNTLVVQYSTPIVQYNRNTNGKYNYWRIINGSNGYGWAEVDKVVYSTQNIYMNVSGDEIFFRVPSPYVMDGLVAVEELPQTMKAQLVDGGLLSVALKVLAILLGVSLVVRWVYLFVRSKS